MKLKIDNRIEKRKATRKITSILLVCLSVFAFMSCKQQTENSNSENGLKIENKESNEMNDDAKKAAEISLQFDAIQPLAALTGNKEYVNELGKLNKEYEAIEDKYTGNKTEFTKLVGKYRDKLQNK